MNIKTVILLLTFTALINGCLFTNPSDSSDEGGETKPLRIKTSASEIYYDPAAVVKFDITRNVLELTTRYGGGCEVHDFELYWDGLFMESYPVQVNLQLSHNSHNDMCRALITDNLYFDLTLLKTAYSSGYQAAQGEIIIHIYEPERTNTKRHTVRYTFNR